MKLTKIKIQNFKSIQDLEFNITEYGNSYTRMLLGVNEVGKSNILKAMSYFNPPQENHDFEATHNKKNEEDESINLEFYMKFEKEETLINALKEEIEEGGELLTFKIQNIFKKVFLKKGVNQFRYEYNFEIAEIPDNLFIKQGQVTKTVNGQNQNVDAILIKKGNDERNTYSPLIEDKFKESFRDKILNTIKDHSPQASFWQPLDEYLISSSINLNTFKENLSNIPLKNIFALASYDTDQKIKEQIDKLNNPQERSKLQSKLNKKINDYVQGVWQHNIKIIIEIDQTGSFNLYIRDKGESNEHDRYTMKDRSDGFKQFISLILSLSIESKSNKNRLILIDEPETHLHPSSIRDLGKELLAIGENNYLFVATHSPFLIDKTNKERNIIITKNNNAETEKKEIKSYEDIKDDEVLEDAFGINVYKDLMIPHRILVEGESDKIILEKAFKIKNCTYGITNGMGNNTVTTASKFNKDEIDILVILDDDKAGKRGKKDVLKIGGVYEENKNVFTIRDLVGELPDNATIEDCLGKAFIESKFKEHYKSKFEDGKPISLEEGKPFMKQVKVFLQKENRDTNEVNHFLNSFKTKISNEFNPSETSFPKHFPLLDSLYEKIKKNFQEV